MNEAATKTDLHELRGDLRSEIAELAQELRGEMAAMETRLVTTMLELNEETKRHMGILVEHLDQRFQTIMEVFSDTPPIVLSHEQRLALNASMKLQKLH